ncbi:uncharacterized protein LOC121429044 isoform X7 [Lytechinus variegatus]|uniref:uncharacterized protein LOC121429044 isoform X7 n=1 Tax=Lytechinus variegatus TaxID=7654 RepID=UPI001BB2BC0E|nr:uncharacterized protein LOC121429044 isoform X7 [Lytechinus variegatus]
MASRCWRTLGTAPIACIILSTVFIPSIFAKPFFSKEFKLSKADVQYYTTSPDYAYVKPIRLGTRHQRSIEESSVRSTSEYTVEGFDQVFNIQLSESMDLFNAGLLVRRISGEGDVRIEQPQTGCYHQGHLKDSEDTTSVSLSTCSDLVGMIRTPEADFALKPLKEEHILQMKSEDNEVPSHIMYKLSPSDMAAQQVNTENERRKDSKSERRETSGTKYLETSVVADSKMFDYHGDDTEFYLFTILNQVAGLFRDRSLSTDLRLLITSITIMEEPQINLDLTDELSHSLKSFCKWQKGENSDISILLTRRDLEIGGNDGVTGKSKDIGGACDPSRRCIIVQDHGPSGTIFTLAHEIGHSLGMYHDDSESECTDNKNIMASGNSGGSEAFKWSRCSNNDLLEFLSSDDSQCLDEVVDDFPAYNSETVLMPGHFYDALKQCQMTFGPEATVSDGYLYSKDMCAELQCVLPGESESVTNHIPALDGTKCSTARGAICVHGQCLKVVSMYDCEGNSDGQCVPEWLPGSFGECQDDCFAYRNVFCVERRDDGTTVLISDLSLCPLERPDEREYCCQTQPVVGETGYQILNRACSVTCGTGVETRVVACVDSEGTVVNDTFCTDERPSEMGECATPCPGVTYILFYGAYGECSVTCGDGVESRDAFCSTSQGATESIEICRSVFPSVVTERDCNLGTCPGTVVDTFFYVTNPVGDCSVTCGDGIQQLAVTCQNLDGMTVDDANCASLQRPASSEVCMREPCSEVYRYGATTFSVCSVTCGTGMQTRTVYCLNEANRVVDEAFCSNLERPSESQSCTLQACSITYFYVAEPFPECTLTCGNQVFTRTVSCRSSEGDLVSSVNCVNAGLVAPPTTFDCELEPCGNYVYSVGEYGECSATCGVGIQQRSVTCIDLDNDNATVANNLCSENAPTSAILCDQGDCPTEYSYLTSPYSDCNCAGIQTRIVICITFVNGAPVPASDVDCQRAGIERLNDSQSCQVPISCNPVWRFGEWSDCSVSCGNGVRSRVVFCVESEESNVIVPSTSCNATEEPASVDICNEGDCITYTWVSENFGECSVTCGEGVRIRNVLCYAISGGTFEVVDASRCDPLLEPPSEEICALEECGGVFEATPWSECSVTCAQGVQTRSVSCVLTKGSGTVIPDMECGNMTRPAETRDCYLEACPEPYGCDQSYPTEGSITYTLESPGYPMGYPADLECSKNLVAPEGSIIRITFTDLQLEDGCAYDSVRLIDAETSEVTSLCDEVDLPYVYESSGSTLEVLFTTDASVSRRGFTANYQAIPATIIEYRTGEWSQCSVTCGMGVERRELTCVEDGEEVDDSECVGLPMPSVERPCMLDECPLPGACGENILRRGPGSITSPNYPSVYPNNVTCGNTIRAPPGLVVNITVDFLLFINQGLPCGSGDYIEVKDSSSDDSLIVCQSSDLINKISLTNEVSVMFFSDSSPAPSGTGFSLSFTFVEPEVDICGSNVTTSRQPIYSPNYPDNYDDNTTCVTEIINDDGCISIEFLVMDIDNGDFIDGICRGDSLTISDQNNPSLSQTYCSEISRESRWLSASGNVEVSFTSNSVNTSSGYIAIPRFVECPQAFWIPLPFGNCSAICGVGNRTRELECRNALTNELTDPSECPEEEPPRTEPCFLEECPSCDVTITEGNQVFDFPFNNDYYLYNDECTLTITNNDGCISLFFTSLDIDQSVGDECGDYLSIYDPQNVYANEPYCRFMGTPGINTVTYMSLGSTVELRLRTPDSERFKSVGVFPSFSACAPFAFVPGPWSECSASCEGGTRTREVLCLNVLTREEAESTEQCNGGPEYDEEEECNTEECPDCLQQVMTPGVITSPGFSMDAEGYENNLDCMFNITNPNSDECITISFINFDLGDPSDNCSDYIQISDRAGDVDALYCGLEENATAPVFYSRSAYVEVVFITDEEDRNAGFEALVGFTSCPSFGFFAGNFSECSVTCGEGLSFRNVTCQDLDTRETVNESLCEDIKPDDARPCYRGPCPTCDAFIYEDAQYINSPNFPDTYEGDLNCTTIITAPAGMCINLFIISLELPEPDMYAGCFGSDYLLFIDAISSEAPYFALDQVYCGSEETVLWYSAQNIAFLTFFTTEGGFPGYQIYSSFVDCQQYFYAVTPFGECSVTCGLGELSREIFCVDRNANYSIVNDSFCASDIRPVETVPCYPGDCPIGCDLFVTDNNQTVATDDSVEQICEVSYLNPEDGCIRFDIVLDLPEPDEEGECEDGSYVAYIEDAEYGREMIICGNTSFSLTSRSNNTLLTLFSSGEGSSSVSVINTFVECPLYGFIAGEEYDECSESCDGGFQMRNVSCIELASGTVVNDSFCEDERPEDTRPCNENPCPTCDRYINATGIIRQRSSESNDECVYTVDVGDSCIAVSFLAFSLQDEMDGECSENVHIRDLAPYTDELDETFCGDGPPFGYQWFSRSGQVQIRYDSAGQQGADYNLFVRVLPCPQYGFIYGNYSECSVTCGEGVQTRDVSCVELDNGVPGNVTSDSQCNDPRPDSTVECELEQCPSCDRNYTLSSSTSSIIVNSDRPYSRLSMCTNTITADDGMCIRVNFASLDIEDSEDCVNDSLLVLDPSNTAINFSVCGSGTVQPIFSTSNMLTMTLSTNGAIEGMGYAAIANRIDCPDVVWSTTNVGSCSVTCGVGVQSRNVFCMNNLNGRRFLQEESCTGERPADEVPCDMGDCPQACNQVFIGEGETELTSPGYPGPYENDTVCPNTYVSIMTCLAVVVADIDLGPADNCQNDYIEIFDSTVDMSETRIRLCGNELPENNLWVGRATPFFIRFTSDESGNYGGYNLSLSYVPCPMQGFTVGEFGECSATCRSGERTRNVTCEDSMGRILPDSSCWGQRPLSSEPCGMNCTYNVREEWSPCSVSCGSGVQERNVSCVDNFGNPVNISLCNIDGMNVTRRQCNLTECPAPVDGNLTQWTSWTSCSVSCGIGTQTRNRTCTNPPPSNGGQFCEGPLFQNEVCMQAPCPPPVDGNYTEWSSWSSCSESCGNGTQTRNRTCTNPAPSNGGADCTGPSTETRVCNTQACPEPVDGNFTQWTIWTTCTLTCGTGVQFRTRSCTNPPPSNGGAGCMGAIFQNRPCNAQSCPPPVDGDYTEWSSWSSCSESCGNGTQTRNRTCTNPPPSNGGADCTGPSTETQFCNTQACPEPVCNNTIDGATTVSGNLTSPNYPDASPADQMCVVNFIIPSGFILNIRFTEFNLNSNCSAESVTLSAPVAGDTMFCGATIVLPASVTYTSDSTLTLLYITDSDISNSPYYFAEFMFISIAP